MSGRGTAGITFLTFSITRTALGVAPVGTYHFAFSQVSKPARPGAPVYV
jgi:hypothetical protein